MTATIIPFPALPAGRVPDPVRAELARVVETLEEHAPAVTAALRDLERLTSTVERALEGTDEQAFLAASQAVGLDRAHELLGSIEWALPDRRWIGA